MVRKGFSFFNRRIRISLTFLLLSLLSVQTMVSAENLKKKQLGSQLVIFDSTSFGENYVAIQSPAAETCTSMESP